ncbi:MAG: hypothetical protein JNM36_12925 [Chitinophagales bacterium]|nr:hypothetical protein [Chitinophagales bacterium]
MIRYILVYLFWSVGVSYCFAQIAPANVKQTAAIEQLVLLHTKSTKNKTTAGFRVQIIQDGNRDVVRNEKALLLQRYPDLKIYELYEAPYFKLRAGDFTNRLEAHCLYMQIKSQFTRAFIVPDKVFGGL